MTDVSSVTSLAFRPGPRVAGTLVLHVALTVLGFAVDRWWAWLVVWGVQSVNLLALPGVFHECVHGHFFRRRWANRVTGTLCGLGAFSLYEVYRPQHIHHHADTCGPDDTEGEPWKFTRRWQIAVAVLSAGLYYTSSLVVHGVRVAFGWSPAWLHTEQQRRRIRINLALLVVTIAAAVTIAQFAFRPILFGWLIPMAVMISFALPFVQMSEHYDAAGPGPVFGNTRTVVSNPLLSYAFLYTNLHTAHHHQPSVPWNELRAHHATIEDRIEDEWIFPGFIAFHRWLWRTLDRPPRSETGGDERPSVPDRLVAS